jgi:glutathione synthase/RimK-type ligase-like ATP-grasp enzyme
MKPSPADYSQGREPLLGMAALMSKAYGGVDLAPLGIELVNRASNDPEDANALLDLSIIMQLDFAPEVAMDLQAQALQIRQCYSLPASDKEAVRVLALMAPGELMANAPLEFLVQDSDISLELCYVTADQPLPASLPEHDVVFVAVNESDANQPILHRIASMVESWPRPVLNAPHRIARLTRAGCHDLLRALPGVVAPAAVRVARETVERIAGAELAVSTVLEGTDFPIIVRPVNSHAGHGLSKLDDAAAVTDYLHKLDDGEFYLSPFIDYCSDDGLFRKYRVVLIAGQPYACHMALSTKWMVHYLNAGMADSAVKRAEEARWMETFASDFAQRHGLALRTIHESAGLDYLVIDCAETATGELLVFEIDSGAVVHAMDPEDVFPYKPPQMRKIFAAFRELLLKAMRRGPVREKGRDGDGA